MVKLRRFFFPHHHEADDDSLYWTTNPYSSVPSFAQLGSIRQEASGRMTLFACCARLCRKANERPLAEKVCDGLRDKFKRYLEGWLVSPNKKLHQEFATEFEFGWTTSQMIHCHAHFLYAHAHAHFLYAHTTQGSVS